MKTEIAKPYKPRPKLNLNKNRNKPPVSRRLVHERYNVTLSCKDAEENEIGQLEGFIIDVGLHGFGLIINEHIPSGTSVEIHFHGKTFEVFLSGKAVWCAELPTSGRVLKAFPFNWRAGLDIDISSKDDAAIMKHIFEMAPP